MYFIQKSTSLENSSKVKTFFVILFILILSKSQQLYAQEKISISKQEYLMGSVFQFTVVAVDTLSAHKYIELAKNEVIRIENLISEWQPHTEVSRVNQNAGLQAVKVSKEVFDLTYRAINYSKLSDGAFDISTASMDHIWKFDGSMDALPDITSIQKSIKNVNYKNIILDSINSTIFLKNKGMKIGFGSIGKAYAADRCRSLLQELKVEGGIINASGDITTWGTQENGKPWVLGIYNPFKKNKIGKTLKINQSAITTSGSYEKYVEFNGLRYSHIIDPKTGYPSTGLTSVSIYGPSAEFANALSTAIMVLGLKKGIQITKGYPLYNYFIITDKGIVLSSTSKIKS